jgi:hypothetical protein
MQGSNREIFCGKYPKNKISTNEPISTNNTLIDLARQPETQRNFNTFQNSFRGATEEFPWKKYPLEELFNHSTEYHKMYTDRFSSTSGAQRNINILTI